jgi:hypothetical protein
MRPWREVLRIVEYYVEGTNSGLQVARATKFYKLAPHILWVFSMILASYHLLVPRFLENLRTVYICVWGHAVA